MPTKPKATVADKKKTSPKQLTTWGWSRLMDWEKCRAMAKFKHIDKVPQPESEALAHGSEVHELAQQYAVAALKKLPPDLANFTEEFTWLQAHKRQVLVEQQYALDKAWSSTSWFESDAAKARKPPPWMRAVLDAVVPEIIKPLPWDKKLKAAELAKTVVVIDHKTGKVREENLPQLELYAMTAFAVFPHAMTVDAAFWYLDQGELSRMVHKRDQLPALQKKWAARVAPLLADVTFKPKPGRHCTWCPYRRSKGGPCEY